nr:uncharacterized protein LOC129489498 isoform X2 [Symphalangus syndactylus]
MRKQKRLKTEGQDGWGQRQGPSENMGNTEGCNPNTGKFGGANMGGNHPYQSPPLCPAVPEPDSSCHQDGGGDGSGGSTYSGGEQAKEVASERVEPMMRTRKVGLRGADLPLALFLSLACCDVRHVFRLLP